MSPDYPPRGGAVFFNWTLNRSILTGVTVRDNASDRIYDCDDIEPFRLCAKKAGKRRFYPDQPEMTWRFGNGDAQTRLLDVPVPAYFSPGVPMGIIFDFSPNGTLKPGFDQRAPARV